MHDIDFNKIDNLVKDKVLSIDDIKKINSVMEDNLNEYEDLKVLNDIQTKPQETSNGRYEKAVVKIDPITGEKVKVADYNESDEKELSDKLKEAGKKGELEVNNDEKVSADQLVQILKYINYKITDESALQLVRIINKYQAEETIDNPYDEFPKEIQNMINEYIVKHGYGFGYSANTNRIKKFLAKQLLEEYATIIYKDKSKKSFSKALETMWKDTKTDLLDFYKDYPEKSNYYLDTMMSDVDDSSKRNDMKSILDSIYDSYSLSRLINSSKKFKIRKIDYEKPNKVFRDFEFKYKDKPQYNIISLRVAYQILTRYFDNKDIPLQFLILFCKFCSSYSPDNINEHMFMYYTINNISFFDVAKVKDDTNFIDHFKENIIEAVNNLLK